MAFQVCLSPDLNELKPRAGRQWTLRAELSLSAGAAGGEKPTSAADPSMASSTHRGDGKIILNNRDDIPAAVCLRWVPGDPRCWVFGKLRGMKMSVGMGAGEGSRGSLHL